MSALWYNEQADVANAALIDNMVDFSEDTELKSLSGKLLDLYRVTLAEESIDGVRGGVKSRICQGREAA